MKFQWTEEATTEAFRMWQDGRSASEIGAHFGVSRNAVLGKVHRAAMASRSTPHLNRSRPRKAAPKERAPKAARPRVPRSQPQRDPLPAFKAAGPMPDTAAVEGSRRVPLIELTNSMCRWPIGDPKEPGFGFCGLPAAEGRSYCRAHHRRAYNGVSAAYSP